jgi:Protein of unknown function, DUF547
MFFINVLFILNSFSLTSAPSHSAFDALLKKYVNAEGKVNYKGFKTEKNNLEAYIKTLSLKTPDETFSKNDKIAYWINAYNALTINLILENYPLNSITQLDKGKTWDVKRFELGGVKYSLNDIENNILRPLGDARIHFALNCAAKSCPPLANQAFSGDNLDGLLEARTKAFMNSKANSLMGSEIKLSKIFDWYSKDFGDIIKFVNRYSKIQVPKTAKLAFTEYDWSLNQ